MRTFDILILGQAEINRRAAEIADKKSKMKMVVGQILGVMPRVKAENPKNGHAVNMVFPATSTGVTWWFWQAMDDKFYVCCFTGEIYEGRVLFTTNRHISDHWHVPQEPGDQEMMSAYEALPEFVDQMFAEFPTLRGHLDLLFEAYEAAKTAV